MPKEGDPTIIYLGKSGHRKAERKKRIKEREGERDNGIDRHVENEALNRVYAGELLTERELLGKSFLRLRAQACYRDLLNLDEALHLELINGVREYCQRALDTFDSETMLQHIQQAVELYHRVNRTFQSRATYLDALNSIRTLLEGRGVDLTIPEKLQRPTRQEILEARGSQVLNIFGLPDRESKKKPVR